MTTDKQSKTVLLSPLDWGLGHASRIISLVMHFEAAGFKVILGGSGKSGDLLRTTFRHLPFIEIPSFTIRYPFRKFLFPLNIIIQLPLFFYSIFREHHHIKRAVKKHAIDIVVSDNRYGLRCKSTYNIIITHQISPVLPGFLKWAEYPLYIVLKNLIERFHECWIPDYAGENNLSGKLSHRFTLPENAKFIGHLSRFSVVSNANDHSSYDLAIVLSGPQPELGRITRRIIDQALESKLETIIICGLQESDKSQAVRQGLKIVSHLEPPVFKKVLEMSGTIICTAGYSGIMDLVELSRTAILIPTPGQTEQEYLCSFHQSRRNFLTVPLSELNLQDLAKYQNKLELCTMIRREERSQDEVPRLLAELLKKSGQYEII